jgi:hypothetical protein
LKIASKTTDCGFGLPKRSRAFAPLSTNLNEDVGNLKRRLFALLFATEDMPRRHEKRLLKKKRKNQFWKGC